jgi:hypothetical protein
VSEREKVVCGSHGSTPVTFTCRHVASGVACGFHADDSDSADPWPDAVCDACDERITAAGGPTDETTDAADIKVICTHCYEQARDRNRNVPPHARGRRARLDDDEQRELLVHACRTGNLIQDEARHRWRFDQFARWYFDADARTLTFSDPTLGRLVADVRLVGSFSTKSNTFQWSWVLYDDNHPMIAGIADLRGFGDVRGLSRLTTKYFACEQEEAWELTSLAAYLLGCQALYRAPFDHLYWFMLLSGFRQPLDN